MQQGNISSQLTVWLASEDSINIPTKNGETALILKCKHYNST